MDEFTTLFVEWAPFVRIEVMTFSPAPSFTICNVILKELMFVTFIITKFTFCVYATSYLIVEITHM